MWGQGRHPMSSLPDPIPAYPSAADKPGYRTKTIGTRITADELREVEAAAELAGKSLSEWLRDLTLKTVRQGPPVPTELLLEEVAALRYIVLNLFAAMAQAGEKNTVLASASVPGIRDAADSRKRAAALKLIQEFVAPLTAKVDRR